MTPSLSIVVPAGADLAGARRVVDALAAQCPTEERAEVVLVVCDDLVAEAQKIVASPIEVRVASLPARVMSLPHARNLGLARARGEIVLLIDADVVPDRTLLHDVRAAAAQGFDVIGAPGLHDLEDTMFRAIALNASLVALRRSALVHVGDGFVPTMPVLGGLELGVRLRAKGRRFALLGGVGPGRDPIRPGLLEILVLLERHPYHSLALLCERLYGEPVELPGQYVLEPAELIEGLMSAVGETDARRRAITSFVDAAVAGDVLKRDGRLDRYFAEVWLGRHSQLKQLGLGHDYNFGNLTPAQRGKRAAPPRSVVVVGTYEVYLPTELVARLDAPTISIPLPVPHESFQRDVRVYGFEPPELDANLNARRDGIVRFRLGPEHQVLRYRFECTVEENVRCATTGLITEADRKSKLSPQHLVAAREVIDQVCAVYDVNDAAPASRRARALYEWMLENTAYGPTNRPFRFVFDGWVGTCYHRSKLFVECCRLWGIPARERRGGQLGRTWTEAGRVWTEACAFGYSPLAHMWAEFHDGTGWIPVDFIGADYGARQLTRENVVDPEFRRVIEERTPLLEDYYFGSLDPHRVHAAESAGRLVTYPMGRTLPGKTLNAALTWQTRHVMRCEVRG